MGSLDVDISEFVETYEKFHRIYEQVTELIQQGIDSETTDENSVSGCGVNTI